jgi:hypothetical protein
MGSPKLYGRRDLTALEKEQVLEQVLLGKSFISICEDLKIDRQGLYEQTIKDPLFKEKIAEFRDIANDDLLDAVQSFTDGIETLAEAACARVKSENAFKIVALRNPKKFGSKIDINMQHSIDLSSVLNAAEARVIPLLEMKRATAKAIEAAVVSSTSSSSTSSDSEDTENVGASETLEDFL